MPAIIVSYVEFLGGSYYINLTELANSFPHITAGKEVEIRNKEGNLIKRFKPFKTHQLITTIINYTTNTQTQQVLGLRVPEDIASQLNLGRFYRITFIITKYGGRSFLPFELKPIGYNAQNAAEAFSRIELNLLSLCLDHPLLNEAVSYLWDSYKRLEENDVEGARTSIRKSLEVLRKQFLPNLTVGKEEVSRFPINLEKLVSILQDFLHYRGPHTGPAPRSTTEMIFTLTTELIRYLAKMVEDKIILMNEGKSDELA